MEDLALGCRDEFARCGYHPFLPVVATVGQMWIRLRGSLAAEYALASGPIQKRNGAGGILGWRSTDCSCYWLPYSSRRDFGCRHLPSTNHPYCASPRSNSCFFLDVRDISDDRKVRRNPRG